MNEELRNLVSMVSQYEHLSTHAVLATMAVAALCSVLAYLVYRFFYRGVVYSDNFGILIVMVSVVTAFIIITIGANLVLSLGMVGALSIIRFRAVIKEPLDAGFIYWGVAIGLTCGARLYLVAILGTLSVGLVYIAMTFMRKEKRHYLMILRYKCDDEKSVDKLLQGISYKLKNKTCALDNTELTVEIKVVRNQTDFMKAFAENGKILSASLVEYNGDYV